MEEIKERKQELRKTIQGTLDALPPSELKEKTKSIGNRLFEFANFLESKIALLYVNSEYEVNTKKIIQKAYSYNKIVVLPAFTVEKKEMSLMKVDDVEKDLIPSPRGVLEPDQKRCKAVPIECIDIAIIPGVAMDEKGGRLGTGYGYYDRLIPLLPITTRKVGLCFEEQIVNQVPMESHDKQIDIIITQDRVIYKI